MSVDLVDGLVLHRVSGAGVEAEAARQAECGHEYVKRLSAMCSAEAEDIFFNTAHRASATTHIRDAAPGHRRSTLVAGLSTSAAAREHEIEFVGSALTSDRA